MPNLFKRLYDKAETLKGKKLVITLVLVFIVFLGIGILIGQFTNLNLNKDETSVAYEDALNRQIDKPEYTGRIIYTNPINYPGEKVSYYLEDASGNMVILLKARDSKLLVAEGLDVSVRGEITYTKGGEKVLDVEEVIISNATN